MKVRSILACMLLAACSGPETARRVPIESSVLPPMRTFAQAAPEAPAARNAAIARDILDLTMTLENGTKLPVFTRFEGPVTVRLTGSAPVTLSRDLDALIDRLRREAHIDIRRVGADEDAAITVETVSRRQIRAVDRSIACFVQPNVASWREYRARRGTRDTRWASLNERRRMGIFLPADVSPQEMRSCLHEELAQALGPVADLYRLTQSVFNDDDFNVVLTGFDMLVLKAVYDPALATGMTRAEVAARLPGILARINPRGGDEGLALPLPRNDEWRRTIVAASNPVASRSARLRSAERAVALARSWGASDPRLGYSAYVLGRLLLRDEPDRAIRILEQADAIFARTAGTAAARAHIAMKMAAYHLATGDASRALRLADRHIRTAERGQNAALLSDLLMIRAEALLSLGRESEGRRAEEDALAWARYGHGPSLEARAAEFRAISPRFRTGAGT